MKKRKGLEGTVEVEHKGKRHVGRFTVKGRLVTLNYGARSMTTQVGGSPAKTIARVMLRELVAEDREP